MLLKGNNFSSAHHSRSALQIKRRSLNFFYTIHFQCNCTIFTENQNQLVAQNSVIFLFICS